MQITTSKYGYLSNNESKYIIYYNPNKLKDVKDVLEKLNVAHPIYGYDFHKQIPWYIDEKFDRSKKEWQYYAKAIFVPIKDIFIGGERIKNFYEIYFVSPDNYIMHFEKYAIGIESINGDLLFHLNKERRPHFKYRDIEFPEIKVKPGYKFISWIDIREKEINLDDDIKSTSIYAKVEKLDDVIIDDGKTTKPEGYVEVFFNLGHAAEHKENISLKYFVKKNTDISGKLPITKEQDILLKKGYSLGKEIWTESIKHIYAEDTKYNLNYNYAGDITDRYLPGYLKIKYKARE